MNETERFHEVMSRAGYLAAVEDTHSPVTPVTEALAAYYRNNEDTVDRPSDAYVHIYEGRRYVVLVDQARTVAVYRTPNNEEPHRLHSWPPALERRPTEEEQRADTARQAAGDFITAVNRYAALVTPTDLFYLNEDWRFPFDEAFAKVAAMQAELEAWRFRWASDDRFYEF